MAEEPLLRMDGLKVAFPKSGSPRIHTEIVRDVTLDLYSGKTIGLVGESGSGKSMTALSIMGMVPYPGQISGSIRLKNQELCGLPEAEYAALRGSKLAIVFQDPATALNPVLTIGHQLMETAIHHRHLAKSDARKFALDNLRQVGIPDPARRMGDYPHQLSGGMKQRILIAMALIPDPEILLLDEPTTALDVTVQAQILDLIEFMQSLKRTSIVLISHDLAVVSEISDEIAVMYAGKVVEKALTHDILTAPRHPYTSGLLSSIPALNSNRQPLQAIPGVPPDPNELPSGCPFHPRCFRAIDQCPLEDPGLVDHSGRYFACWNPVNSHD